MNNIFYNIKLRNNNTGEYVYILGDVDVTPITFAHIKKKNIYGLLKQSQVAILKNISINIEYCTESDKNTIQKWWEVKSNIWIEKENNIPIKATFVDTDFGLKQDMNTEDNTIYFKGSLSFE